MAMSRRKLSINLRLLTIALLISLATNGQAADSSKHSIPATWTKFMIAPRVVFGIQKSFYTNIGFSLQRYFFDERHGFIVYNMYSSFEWIPSTKGEKAAHGALAGYELINNGVGGALEIKYLTNSDSTDFIITPKLGFGIGFVNLFYGYNFSTNKYPFPRIGRHQFSLVINTNALFYASKFEKNKSR